MRPRVLIVDDSRDTVALLRRIVEGCGLEARVADTGRRALAEIARETPDVVFLDIMMPEMDGLETLEQLKASFETSRIPVILLTSRSSSDDVVTGYQNGADYYITKPFSSNDVVTGLEMTLGIKLPLPPAPTPPTPQRPGRGVGALRLVGGRDH